MLQAAVAAANVDPGVILLPAGTYVLSRPLAVTSCGVVLRGEGVSGPEGSCAGCRHDSCEQGSAVGWTAAEAEPWQKVLVSAAIRCPALGQSALAGIVSTRGKGLLFMQEDKTRVLIRKSLTDIFGGGWTANSAGALLMFQPICGRHCTPQRVCQA
jgi:hypothetical protein